MPSPNQNKTPYLKWLESFPVCLLSHFCQICEALTFWSAATSRPACLVRSICDAFLTTAGATSGHSQGLSLAVVGLRRMNCSSWLLTRVPCQWRKKHDCSQSPGCNVGPGWVELVYAENKCFHLNVDQKYVQQKLFYEKLKKLNTSFP